MAKDRTTWICLGLVLITLAVFWPVARHDYVNFDDPDYASQNPHITAGLSWQGVRWAFTSIHSTNWHPLTTLSHMLDCQLCGVNPAGPHLVNLAFHLLNTLLLFLLLRRLTGAVWPSALVAALFALHPLHVESVAWISERKDVLSTCFGLLTLWAYGTYATATSSSSTSQVWKSDSQPPRKVPATAPEPTPLPARNRRWRFYLLALLLFALGLMSKPMLVTLPLVLLLLDYWPLRRLALPVKGPVVLRLVAEKIPFLVLAAASSTVTFLVQRASGTVMPLDYISWQSRLANIPVAYIRYLGKFFWPVNLTVFYPYVHFDWTSWPVLGSAALLIALTAAALTLGLGLWPKARSSNPELRAPDSGYPWLLVGWLWFLGTLVPVIGLVQVGEQALADRYSYLSFIGLFIMLGWNCGLPFSTFVPRAVAVLALISCALVSARQLSYWQNTQTLFEHATRITERNHAAYANLGMYFVEQGQYDRAIECYQAALAARTNFPHAWNNLGLALVHQKKYDEGIVAFQKALELYANLPETEVNLGNAFMAVGKTSDAIAHYAAATRLKPDYPLAQANLGGVLLRQGQAAEAEPHLRLAVDLNPSNADVHSDLARALNQLGHADDAIAEYQRALTLRPAFYSARLRLGDALLEAGKADEALAQYRLVLQDQPNDAQAHYRLALALSGRGDPKGALEHYRAALAAAPDSAEILNNLAWLLAANPDPQIRNGPEAVGFAERACKLTDYQEPLLVGTLAAAYAEAGRYTDAVATAEKAKTLAEEAKNPDLAARNAKLLELYRAGKPYHETP